MCVLWFDKSSSTSFSLHYTDGKGCSSASAHAVQDAKGVLNMQGTAQLCLGSESCGRLSIGTVESTLQNLFHIFCLNAQRFSVVPANVVRPYFPWIQYASEGEGVKGIFDSTHWLTLTQGQWHFFLTSRSPSLDSNKVWLSILLGISAAYYQRHSCLSSCLFTLIEHTGRREKNKSFAWVLTWERVTDRAW